MNIFIYISTENDFFNNPAEFMILRNHENATGPSIDKSEFYAECRISRVD